MDDFSIQSDITPMRGEYFPTSRRNSISSQERTYLDMELGGAEDALLDRQLKLVREVRAARNSDLAYENNLFALKTAKDKAARERESYDKMPALMEELNGALSSDKSPYEQQEDLGKITMSYAGLLASNPTAGKLVSGATASTNAAIRGAAYVDSKEKARLAEENAGLAYASKFADKETRKGLYMQDGIMTEKEQRQEQDIMYRQDIAQAEKGKKLAISQNKATLSVVKDAASTLIKMEPALSPQDQRDAWREQHAGMKNPPKMPLSFPKAYSPVQVEVLNTVTSQLGLDEEEFKDMTPAQKHKALLPYATKLGIEIQGRLGEIPKAAPSTKAAKLFP